jgi:hypothetical protein
MDASYEYGRRRGREGKDKQTNKLRHPEAPESLAMDVDSKHWDATRNSCQRKSCVSCGIYLLLRTSFSVISPARGYGCAHWTEASQTMEKRFWYSVFSPSKIYIWGGKEKSNDGIWGTIKWMALARLHES